MPLGSGTRLGPYEIVAPIGAGGMGEVYRARDTRLQRDVAIKVLPTAWSSDPDRLARFEQEARAAAALNHPNILAVFDLGTSQDAPYIVSELLEGETLRDHLSRAAMPVRKVVEYAVQIAHGLGAAHEKGIVHRDLKPENVFITTDNRVKILDFGLAKLTQVQSAGEGVSALATTPAFNTQAAPHTLAGVVLGTVGYMAPEQVRGFGADHRADIFALGAILYEMLSGRRAFGGDTAMDTMSAILKEQPPGVPAERRVPPALVRVTERCLEKNPGARFQSTRDLAFALESLAASSDSSIATVSLPAPRAARRLTWALGAVVTVAASVLVAVTYFRPAAAPAPAFRLQVNTPPSAALANFALSPDGRSLVYTARVSGKLQLWLRPMDADLPRPLAGTDNAVQPFWSPDSRSVGFVAGGDLKRIDVTDGRIQTIATPASGAGAAWGTDGTILFTKSFAGPLYRVSANGGTPAEATRTNPPRHSGHVHPQYLPDGRHFVFFAFGSSEDTGVYLGSLDSTDVHRLLDSRAAAVVAGSNDLLITRESALLAQRLNPKSWEPVGEAVTVSPSVAVEYVNGIAAVSASRSGPIAYRLRPEARQLVWFNRAAARITSVGEPDTSQMIGARLSFDETSVVFQRAVGGNTDIWMMDIARGALRRVTVDPADESSPIWSPDRRQIVFGSTRRQGVLDLYQKSVDGPEPEKLLLASPQDKNAQDWSPDSRFVLYSARDARNNRDLWALPLSGDGKPLPVAQTSFAENNGRFSPDGRWIAYQSDETGRNEIYVQAFPSGAAKTQISTTGGTQPSWLRDGKEMFYLAPDNRLMAVPITIAAARIEAGQASALMSTDGGAYGVSRDGQRFLLQEVVEERSPITILLNWSLPGR